MRGTIPAKITYLFNSSYLSSEKNKDIPAFVSDANSVTCKETGKRWASHRKYNYQTQRYEDSGEVIEFTLPNEPLKNVKITGIDKRYQGPSAWKVIIPVEGHNLYMDLREDSLKDAILNAGVQAGGILNGEWVWAVVGSERKLTRVGSEAWLAFAENSKRKSMKEIKKNFEKGSVYKTITNQSWIYLGKINSYRKVIKSSEYDNATRQYKKVWAFEPIKRIDLWADIRDNVKNLQDLSWYNFKLGKAPKLYEKVDEWELSPSCIEDLRTNISTAHYSTLSDYWYMQDASLPNKPLRSLNLPLTVLNEFISAGIDVDNV